MMKKYNKPTVQVIELSVKESLSAIPTGFQRNAKLGTLSGSARKNITIYRKTSVTKS